MPISRERLRFLSAETGFREGSLEKVVRLGELIGAISRHPLLGEALALKGGTALNLGFGPPPRLSVDVDRLQVGELRPEILFPDDPERAELLARHPALLWKAKNAKDHAASRRRRGP